MCDFFSSKHSIQKSELGQNWQWTMRDAWRKSCLLLCRLQNYCRNLTLCVAALRDRDWRHGGGRVVAGRARARRLGDVPQGRRSITHRECMAHSLDAIAESSQLCARCHNRSRVGFYDVIERRESAEIRALLARLRAPRHVFQARQPTKTSLLNRWQFIKTPYTKSELVTMSQHCRHSS